MENLYSDLDDSNDFVHALLQKQSRKKLMELVECTPYSMGQIAQMSGISLDIYNQMIKGEIEITPFMMARILDICNYFDMEETTNKEYVC